MTVEDIDTGEAIANIRQLLKDDKNISPGLKAAIEVMIFLVSILTNRLGLNSKNSSKPPSTDFGATAKKKNDEDKKMNKSTKRKPGGQKGRNGVTLDIIDNPDETVSIAIDRRTLPKGHEYQSVAVEVRQVFSIRIKRFVTEYQAEVLIDENGNRYVADFPGDVSNKAQYDGTVKSHAVYLSQFQLIPYERIAQYFWEVAQLPLSQGSLYNFNLKAYQMLEVFDAIAKQRLIDSVLIHADETGINVNGQRIWLHNASNDKWTYFYPHTIRGKVAMDEIGILPNFSGVLCHDHFKPYLIYKDCDHALCNAHHLRELERAHEQDGQRWAKNMKSLLTEMNEATKDAGGALSEEDAKPYLKRYRNLLTRASKECPLNTKRVEGKRGKIPQSKSRNLRDRLVNYENEVLRFLTNPDVPFTNNQGENDIRMTKVQQKISGCFRSLDGAKIFCRIRGFLVTCRKHGVSPAKALSDLFAGRLPDFVE